MLGLPLTCSRSPSLKELLTITKRGTSGFKSTKPSSNLLKAVTPCLRPFDMRFSIGISEVAKGLFYHFPSGHKNTSTASFLHTPIVQSRSSLSRALSFSPRPSSAVMLVDNSGLNDGTP